LRGSVRTLKPEIRDRMEELFRRAVTNTAAAQGGVAEISYRRAYPATVNTAEETAHAIAAAAAIVGDANVIRGGAPVLAGEDFAFMLERVPGAYLFFGQRDGERGATPVHNPGYDFNDDLLPIGSSYLASLVERELA
jgi:hippurate hydrolase